MAGKDKLNFLKFSRIVRHVLNDAIIIIVEQNSNSLFSFS